MTAKFDLNSVILSHDSCVYCDFTTFLSQFHYSLLLNISFAIQEGVCSLIEVTFLLLFLIMSLILFFSCLTFAVNFKWCLLTTTYYLDDNRCT